MGAPIFPPFQIHLGIDKAIEEDLKYLRKEIRRQVILGAILVTGTVVGVIAVLVATMTSYSLQEGIGMDAEVTFSEPLNCEHSCGSEVRIRYVNGECYDIVEPDPLPGTESLNPVHPVHGCKGYKKAKQEGQRKDAVGIGLTARD